jgi:hypothetical protein
MLKKIALAAVFTVVSFVSLSAATVSNASQSSPVVPIGAPRMQGLCGATGWYLGRC